jgi:hypothetical protein
MLHCVPYSASILQFGCLTQFGKTGDSASYRLKTEKAGSDLMLLTYIRKVPGSNLYWDTKYPKVYHNCLQSLQTNAWISLLPGPDRLLLRSFQFIITIVQSFDAL